jgi:hypothetical protein
MVDEQPESPRDWDNLGTMVCFHRRYNLGDEHDYNSEDYGSWAEMEKAIQKQEDAAAILPLYLFDHSGLTISTSPFNCPWDSGQVGFIFVSKAKAREQMMVKRLSLRTIAMIKDILVGEVSTYGQYLAGEVYGFVIDKPETCEACGHVEHEVDESCWGMYGLDYCIEEARSVADSEVANAREQETGD